MEKVKIPHNGHNGHLCFLANMGFQQSNAREYKALVREPKFLCKLCGRVAADARNICSPVKL